MKREVIGYSSVRGALHEIGRLPNQDSYLVKQFKFGTLLVVSDGMGSHPHSDVGSHSVCLSVSRAIQLWHEYRCDDIRLLIPLLHSLWGMDVFPFPKNECGATCLFAFLSDDNLLYLGQLGDGNIYYSVGDELILLKLKRMILQILRLASIASEVLRIGALLQYALVINLLRYVL